jgi:hypothetical protein
MANRFSHSMGRRRAAAGLVAVAVVAGILGACVERTGREGLGVHNATDVPVRFEYVLDGSTALIEGITGPGERSLVIGDGSLRGGGLWGQNGCTSGTLIARDLNGNEIARHGPGLCDTADWEVTRVVPSSS